MGQDPLPAVPQLDAEVRVEPGGVLPELGVELEGAHQDADHFLGVRKEHRVGAEQDGLAGRHHELGLAGVQGSCREGLDVGGGQVVAQGAGHGAPPVVHQHERVAGRARQQGLEVGFPAGGVGQGGPDQGGSAEFPDVGNAVAHLRGQLQADLPGEPGVCLAFVLGDFPRGQEQ